MWCNCSQRGRNLGASPSLRQIAQSNAVYVVIYSNGDESQPYLNLKEARILWKQAKQSDPRAKLIERRTATA